MTIWIKKRLECLNKIPTLCKEISFSKWNLKKISLAINKHVYNKNGDSECKILCTISYLQ